MPVPTTPAKLAVNRRLLHDHAYDVIAARILDGTFPPGTDLDDATLIELTGVSRSPIRQALTKLTEVGLVDMEPNRWTRVAQPSPALFLAGVQIMSTLWALGAETALPRLTETDITDFDQRLDRVLQLGRENDPERAAELIVAVHHVMDFFLTHSGNPLLKPTVDRVQAKVSHTARAGAGQFDLPALGALLEQVRAGVHDRDRDQIDVAMAAFRDLAGELLERITP
jgi:DNA-binding GntR family transcriptional regulator